MKVATYYSELAFLLKIFEIQKCNTDRVAPPWLIRHALMRRSGKKQHRVDARRTAVNASPCLPESKPSKHTKPKDCRGW